MTTLTIMEYLPDGVHLYQGTTASLAGTGYAVCNGATVNGVTTHNLVGLFPKGTDAGVALEITSETNTPTPRSYNSYNSNTENSALYRYKLYSTRSGNHGHYATVEGEQVNADGMHGHTMRYNGTALNQLTIKRQAYLTANNVGNGGNLTLNTLVNASNLGFSAYGVKWLASGLNTSSNHNHPIVHPNSNTLNNAAQKILPLNSSNENWVSGYSTYRNTAQTNTNNGIYHTHSFPDGDTSTFPAAIYLIPIQFVGFA